VLIIAAAAVLSTMCVDVAAQDDQPPAEQAQPQRQSQPQPVSGADFIKQCVFKYPGKDQQGKFTVTLRDRDGQTKRSEYLRFWKDYDGADDVADKMLLFTMFPPDARGSAFMRVAYTPESEKPVDQWIYLPLLKKIRRVTIRDPGDSFLNSNLTFADVSPRALGADEHRYLGVTTVAGHAFHVVESTPKEKRPLYGKRVFWFSQPDNWENCVTDRIDYYDTSGQLLKDQFINWQQIDGAWMWRTSLVRSYQNGTASAFEMSDMRVNVGLSDDLFSARSLERGPELIQRNMPNSAPAPDSKP
jgi:hypothetical protein